MLAALRAGRARIGPVALVLALFVVLVRVLAVPTPISTLAAWSAEAAFERVQILCHGDVPDPAGPPRAPAHHDDPCPLCPVGHGLAAAMMPPAEAAAAPGAAVWFQAVPFTLPPATGPPVARAARPQPRGPPTLLA